MVGTGGEQIVMETVDFCRVVAGRPGPAGDGPSGLLATQIPFSERRTVRVILQRRR